MGQGDPRGEHQGTMSPHQLVSSKRLDGSDYPERC
jgi:hypothetical protein